jgi:ABC-type nickel/cobalt efflux system permease component RcnA
MRYFPTLFLSIVLLFAYACTTTSEDDKLMEEAFNIHEQAMQIAKETKDLLASTDQNQTGLSSIRERLERWEDDLVEVPGFEHEHEHSHDHDHGHGHDHDHSHSTLDLLPADMLAVQKEFLDSIRVIKSDLARLQ